MKETGIIIFTQTTTAGTKYAVVSTGKGTADVKQIILRP